MGSTETVTGNITHVMNLDGTKPSSLNRHLGRFMVVGVVVAGLDFAVFMLLLTVQVPRTWANVAGMAVGFCAGLVGHHHFTFELAEPLAWRVAMRYALGFGFNLILGGVSLELMVWLIASAPVAKVVAMCVVVVSNFVLSRHFVFRRY